MTTLLKSTNSKGEVRLWFPSNIERAKAHACNNGVVEEISPLSKEKRAELNRSLMDNYPTLNL